MKRMANPQPEQGAPRLRVATYNIHKGVRGLGPAQRLEIHNLEQGVAALNADLVFLQEVRHFHHGHARQFDNTWFGWPQQGQADFLAPEGYYSAYRTNAVTREGEHGNALLSRYPFGGEIGHHDVSDHRFEQRGLLHVPLQWEGLRLHAIVTHLGLMHGSRVRQVKRLGQYIDAHIPPQDLLLVAGDFNDWGERLDAPMLECGLRRAVPPQGPRRMPTFPSRMPLLALDRVYLRGLRCVGMQVARGSAWARMSDHLPLLADLTLAP
ncbi:endonuclease/exonuclease/phosphatase family protein [Roseateles sp. BYS180W]|uniref:Endonuclease/exonuclease/phosphatase family protein n=1 Tax=Roseateles rivi TaxID=3299028 RepID=A0ABW7FVC6_9BURK